MAASLLAVEGDEQGVEWTVSCAFASGAARACSSGVTSGVTYDQHFSSAESHVPLSHPPLCVASHSNLDIYIVVVVLSL